MERKYFKISEAAKKLNVTENEIHHFLETKQIAPCFYAYNIPIISYWRLNLPMTGYDIDIKITNTASNEFINKLKRSCSNKKGYIIGIKNTSENNRMQWLFIDNASDSSLSNTLFLGIEEKLKLLEEQLSKNDIEQIKQTNLFEKIKYIIMDKTDRINSCLADIGDGFYTGTFAVLPDESEKIINGKTINLRFFQPYPHLSNYKPTNVNHLIPNQYYSKKTHEKLKKIRATRTIENPEIPVICKNFKETTGDGVIYYDRDCWNKFYEEMSKDKFPNSVEKEHKIMKSPVLEKLVIKKHLALWGKLEAMGLNFPTLPTYIKYCECYQENFTIDYKDIVILPEALNKIQDTISLNNRAYCKLPKKQADRIFQLAEQGEIGVFVKIKNRSKTLKTLTACTYNGNPLKYSGKELDNKRNDYKEFINKKTYWKLKNLDYIRQLNENGNISNDTIYFEQTNIEKELGIMCFWQKTTITLDDVFVKGDVLELLQEKALPLNADSEESTKDTQENATTTGNLAQIIIEKKESNKLRYKIQYNGNTINPRNQAAFPYIVYLIQQSQQQGSEVYDNYDLENSVKNKNISRPPSTIKLRQKLNIYKKRIDDIIEYQNSADKGEDIDTLINDYKDYLNDEKVKEDASNTQAPFPISLEFECSNKKDFLNITTKHIEVLNGEIRKMQNSLDSKQNILSQKTCANPYQSINRFMKEELKNDYPELYKHFESFLKYKNNQFQYSVENNPVNWEIKQYDK